LSIDVTIHRPVGDGLHAPLGGKALHVPHAAAIQTVDYRTLFPCASGLELLENTCSGIVTL